MMRLIRTAAIVAACALAPGVVAAQQRDPRAPDTDQTVTVARGARLTINNFAGEVVLRTWDRDSLRVAARHSTRTKINIKNTETRVAVSSTSSTGVASVDFEITAPAWMPVRVDGTYNFVSIEGAQSEVSAETVRGDILVKGGSGFVTAKSIEGEVIVDGTRGRINASSVSQGIKITGASGEVVAETTNGSITLTKVDARSVDATTVNGDITYEGNLASAGRYRFGTHDGDIVLTVPDTASATFSIRTYNGNFRHNLPLKLSGEAMRGRRTTYVLGGGSAEVEMESFGGDIRLRRSGTTLGRDQEGPEDLAARGDAPPGAALTGERGLTPALVQPSCARVF